MSTSLERYQKLGFTHSIPKIHRYPFACKELSLIIRGAYSKLPKNLQTLILQDTLTAFRLLPGMQARNAVSAAHLLLQGAEAALPKQKKNLAVTEFKHAMVAHKRRCKAHQEENVSGSAQLPQDVLVHVFGFLDMQSLVSVAQVCWSWNLAASDNQLWHTQYSTFFGNTDNSFKISLRRSYREVEDNKYASLQDEMVAGSSIDWKEAFRKAYRGKSLKKLTSSRAYCGYCKTIVWLENMKCSNVDCQLYSGNQQVKPVSSCQVVEYVLDGSLTTLSSSDSDSDSEEDSGSVSKLWAYPRLGVAANHHLPYRSKSVKECFVSKRVHHF